MRARISALFLKEFLVRLALVALVVRALVPLGWMPNPDGLTSGTAIILCTAQGPVAALIGDDGKPASPSPKTAHSDFCMFGGAAAHGVPAIGSALAPPYPKQFALAAGVTTQSPAPSPQYRPQNPRGPPSLV